MVPRAGLQFYLEVRSSGLAQLSQMPDAFASLSKTFSSGSKQMNASEMTSFVMRNLTLLSNARLAIAGYGATGAAAIIELNTPDGIEKLKSDLQQLLKVDRAIQKTESATETAVAVRGRVVLAGARSVVERFVESNAALTLDEDREYLKARAHFAGDPFFAYMDTGSMLFPLPASSKEAKSHQQLASLLAGFGQMPYTIAMGGSMDSTNATLRALIISDQKRQGGLFTTIFSSVQEGQPTASAFASPDTDLFINLMIDWDKFYEGLQSVFEMFAGAVTAMGSDGQQAQIPQGVSGMELMAGLDAALGFSIRYDLIPTLGNELAISISGFDGFTKPSAARTASASRKSAMQSRILLTVALRNPVKFEGYLRKLMGGPKKTPVSFAQTPYRGSIIKYRTNFAYAITGGFFIAGPNASDVKRALDARATGVSLAASTDFRSAVGPARPAMLQMYMSSSMSESFKEMMVAEGAMKQATKDRRSPVGVVMNTNPDGTMMQIRLPSRVALAALTSMTTNNSPVPGINYSSGTAPSMGKRRRSPTLTTEDLRYRRP